MKEADLEYKRFRVAIAIAQEKIARQRVYWTSEELKSKLNTPGLEDAKLLLKIFEKEIKAHNAKLDAADTRVRNLNYKAKNVYKSKAFQGIRLDLKKIDEVIFANPEATIWDLVERILKA